jgi:hypothetical protein
MSNSWRTTSPGTGGECYASTRPISSSQVLLLERMSTNATAAAATMRSMRTTIEESPAAEPIHLFHPVTRQLREREKHGENATPEQLRCPRLRGSQFPGTRQFSRPHPTRSRLTTAPPASLHTLLSMAAYGHLSSRGLAPTPSLHYKRHLEQGRRSTGCCPSVTSQSAVCSLASRHKESRSAPRLVVGHVSLLYLVLSVFFSPSRSQYFSIKLH